MNNQRLTIYGFILALQVAMSFGMAPEAWTSFMPLEPLAPELDELPSMQDDIEFEQYARQLAQQAMVPKTADIPQPTSLAQGNQQTLPQPMQMQSPQDVKRSVEIAAQAQVLKAKNGKKRTRSKPAKTDKSKKQQKISEVEKKEVKEDINKRFSCPVKECSQTREEPEHMVAHYAIHLKNNDKLACKECVKLHKQYPIALAEYKKPVIPVPLKSHIREHVKEHENPDVAQFECFLGCGKTFKSRAGYINHIALNSYYNNPGNRSKAKSFECLKVNACKECQGFAKDIQCNKKGLADLTSQARAHFRSHTVTIK